MQGLSTQNCYHTLQGHIQGPFKDYNTFVLWLEVHFPISDEDHESLVCIANGVVGGKNVNADNAFSLGVKAASDMTGKTDILS